jgi:carbon-monoxide dehydrogenase iron sulfur subunit
MERLFCDPRKCVGCHACELACAIEHSHSKHLWSVILNGESVRPRRAVHVVGSELFRAGMGGRAVSLGCHHCNPAPCVDACISGAMHKESGETICTVSRCVGCWMCVMACPYGAITPLETALKCDLCPDRADRQGRARYACVEACPTAALVVGTFEEFRLVLAQPVERPFTQETVTR